LKFLSKYVFFKVLNIFHHLFVGEWMAAYPKAVFAACPVTMALIALVPV
jgi:hypothetical protein